MDKQQKRDAAALRALLDLCETINLSRETILDRTGAALEDIYHPYAEIETWQEILAIENLCSICNDNLLALEAARRVHVTTLGPLGLGMLSSPTIYDALLLSHEFHSISLWICDVAAQLVDEDVEFIVLAHSLPEPCQHFVACRGLASMKVWFNEMLGREILPTKVYIMAEEPNNKDDFTAFFGCDVVFNADSNAISFCQSYLYEPLRLADEWTRQRCEYELRDLKHKRRSSFTNQVRDLISFGPSINNSESNVAEALQISGSTLRRRLREEGTTYRKLRADTLHDLACVMLLSSTKSVEEVATVLGFAESASFVRSFKRRETVSPGAWRRRQRVA